MNRRDSRKTPTRLPSLFVEIPVKTALDTTPVPAVPAAMTPVAVIRSGRLTLELSNDISESLLCRLLQEVLHA